MPLLKIILLATFLLAGAGCSSNGDVCEGGCVARCEPGLSCVIEGCSGSVQSCPDDIQVCNGACP